MGKEKNYCRILWRYKFISLYVILKIFTILSISCEPQLVRQYLLPAPNIRSNFTYILLFTVLSALIFKLVNCLVIFYIELVKVEITRFVQLVILRLLLILPIHVDFTSCKVDISNMICEHQIDRLEILNSAETRVLDNQVWHMSQLSFTHWV